MSPQTPFIHILAQRPLEDAKSDPTVSQCEKWCFVLTDLALWAMRAHVIDIVQVDYAVVGQWHELTLHVRTRTDVLTYTRRARVNKTGLSVLFVKTLRQHPLAERMSEHPF